MLTGMINVELEVKNLADAKRVKRLVVPNLSGSMVMARNYRGIKYPGLFALNNSMLLQ
jgi:hypothetical protein